MLTKRKGVPKMPITGKRAFTIFSFFLIAVTSLLIPPSLVNAIGDKSEQVWKLESILSGEDTYYDMYKEFKVSFYKRASYEPLEEIKSDSKGGRAKYNEGKCSVVFSWKFDKDITNVKHGDDVTVTLDYSINDVECVNYLAGSWMAFSVNDNYYEQFSGNNMFEKTKEHFPENVNFVRGPDGGSLELQRGKANSTQMFTIHFPDFVEPDTYFPIKLSIFRYYFPNTPVAIYVFKSLSV